MKQLCYLYITLFYLITFCEFIQGSEEITKDSLVLTLEEAEDLALQQNQTLQAQLHTLFQSYYAHQEAKGNLLPQITAIAEAGVRKEGQCSGNYLFSLKQVIYDPTLYYGTRETSLNYTRIKLELTQQMIDILFQVRQAYYQAIVAQKHVEIDRSAMTLFKEGVRKYTHQVDLGLATLSELNQIKLALTRATATLYASQTRLKDQLYKLLILLSLPPETKIELIDQEIPIPPLVLHFANNALEWCQTEFDTERMCSPSLIETWEGIALQYNPEVQRGLINQSLAQVEIKKRKADMYPSIHVFANGGHTCYQDKNFCWDHNWNAGIQLNWTLFDGGKMRQRIRQAREADMKTEYLTKQTKLTIQIEVRRLLMDIENAYQAYLIAQQGEQLAKEGLDLVERQQQLNALTTLEYREAIQAWQLAQHEKNQAKATLLLAYYSLIKQTGSDLL